MIANDFVPALALWRGAYLESLHAAAVAVVDASGRVIAHAGNPHTPVWTRSAAKPFQALPFVTTGAHRALALDRAHLAIACASHKGLPPHVEVVDAILGRAALAPTALDCGVHPVNGLCAHTAPATPRHHNCSGKHAAMLATAAHLGQPLGTYLDREGALQRRVFAGVAAAAGVAAETVAHATDGCSAPNPRLPLAGLARAFANLHEPRVADADMAQALTEVGAAMAAHPALIRAPGHFDSELNAASGGRLIAKCGAEGIEAIGIAPGVVGVDAIGIAVKVLDGGERSKSAALIALAVLEQLGAIDGASRRALATHGYELPLPQTNWQGRPTGRLEAVVALERVAPPGHR